MVQMHKLKLKKPELTLLAIRKNLTGKYLDFSKEDILDFYNISSVKTHKGSKETATNIKQIKNETGIEGYVIYFLDNDEYIKIKTDEYVTMHRVVSFFDREDMVLEAVLQDKIDDLIPALTQDQADKIKIYAYNVNAELFRLASIIDKIVNTAKSIGMDRKTFALEIVSQADKRIQGVYFSCLDDKLAVDCLRVLCQKDSTILNTRWN